MLCCFYMFQLRFLLLLAAVVPPYLVHGWTLQLPQPHHGHTHVTSFLSWTHRRRQHHHHHPQQGSVMKQSQSYHPSQQQRFAHGTNSEDVYIITGANGYIGRAMVHELLLHHMVAARSTSTTTYVNHDDTDDNTDTDVSNHKSYKIVCLVRANRVDPEQSYWNQQLLPLQQQLDNNNKNDTTCSITVLPYDMLDGGHTFQLALDFVVSPPLEENSNATTTLPTTTTNIASLCVFHVASVFGPTDRYEQTAMENVNGTIDLIHTYGSTIQRQKHSQHHHHPNVVIVPDQCRFILTSSMAAVRGTGQIPYNQQYYTHQDWNTYSDIVANATIRDNANWGTYYQWSKMESERQAWDLCRNQWSDCLVMTALCPSFVFGPLMDATSSSSSSSSSYSITLVDQWIRGVSPVQSRLFVDVRDVAKAHVLAAMNDAAIGQRIIVSTEARIPSQEIAQWIKDEIGRCHLPVDMVDPDQVHYDATFQGGSIPIGTKEVDATAALQSLLGMTLRPVQDTIVDMTRILLSKSK